jgi:hypothetical protein
VPARRSSAGGWPVARRTGRAARRMRAAPSRPAPAARSWRPSGVRRVGAASSAREPWRPRRRAPGGPGPPARQPRAGPRPRPWRPPHRRGAPASAGCRRPTPAPPAPCPSARLRRWPRAGRPSPAGTPAGSGAVPGDVPGRRRTTRPSTPCPPPPVPGATAHLPPCWRFPYECASGRPRSRRSAAAHRGPPTGAPSARRASVTGSPPETGGRA